METLNFLEMLMNILKFIGLKLIFDDQNLNLNSADQ